MRRHTRARQWTNNQKWASVERLESRWLLTAISSGQTVAGHINSAAQQDKYTFPGAAGGSIVVSIGASGLSNVDGEVQIFDPLGKLLGSATAPNPGSYNQSAFVTVKGTVDGTYSVIATAANGTDGNYKLAVASVPEPQFSDSQDGPVTSGQTISGDLDGELHAYSFPGKAGGSIVASIGASGLSNLDGEVQIFDPTGKLLGSATAPNPGSYNQSAFVMVKGTVDGTYYMVATAANGTEGNYKLAIASVPEPQFSDSQDGPVTSGQTITGDLDGELHAYSLPGKAGGNIVASIGASGLSNLDGEVQIFDPTGKLLGSARAPNPGSYNQSASVTVKGTVDGTYYVVATAANGTEGNYKLAVASVPEPQFSDSQDGPVASGQIITGDMDGELHAYSLLGKAGGYIVASIGASGLSNLDGEVQIFDPTGKLLGSATAPNPGSYNQSASVTVNATVDGIYYVVATAVNATEGNFKLAVASVPEPQFSDSQNGPVASGQTITGDMDGELHSFSFAGAAGGNIVASIKANGLSNLDGEVQVFDPTGKLLGSATAPNPGSYNQSASVTVKGTVDGTYYAVVSPTHGTEGNFAFSVTSSPPTTLPTVSVVASDPTASEPGTDTGKFTISRGGSTSSALTVKYSVSGSATNGTDYNSLSGSVTIPANSSSATVTVTPKDDATIESTETVVLTLASGTGYTVGSPKAATVNIVDNEFHFPLGDGKLPPTITGRFGGNATGTKATYSGHLGEDERAGLGTSVFAFAAGKVLVAHSTDDNSYGKYIILDHTFSDGTHVHSLYAHLSQVLKNVNDPVNPGDPIGKSGNTGGVDPHLHFAITDAASSSPGRGYAGFEFPESADSITVEGRTFYNPSRFIERGMPLSTGISVGALSGTRTFSGSVNASTPNVFYRFTLGGFSNIDMKLTGLTADANLQLIRDANSNGKIDTGDVLQTSSSADKSSESISGSLPAGTYLVRVFAAMSASAGYSLSIASAATSEPGGSFAAASNLGTFPGNKVFVGSVSSTDTDDFFKFTLTGSTNYGMILPGVAAGTKLQLLRDVNGNGSVDNEDVLQYTSGTTNQSLLGALNAGTYFARVLNLGGPGSSANYRLVMAFSASSDPGATLSSAKNAGPATGKTFFRDSLSTSDTNDYYRMVVTTSGQYSFNLTGLSANADLQLIQDIDNDNNIDSGETLQTSSKTGVSADAITRTLAAGTYYIRVFGSVAATYSLSISK